VKTKIKIGKYFSFKKKFFNLYMFLKRLLERLKKRRCI